MDVIKIVVKHIIIIIGAVVAVVVTGAGAAHGMAVAAVAGRGVLADVVSLGRCFYGPSVLDVANVGC